MRLLLAMLVAALAPYALAVTICLMVALWCHKGRNAT